MSHSSLLLIHNLLNSKQVGENYFTIIPLEDGFTFNMSGSNTYELEYRINNIGTWETLTSNGSDTINKGSVIHVRGSLNNVDKENCNIFNFTKQCKVKGNIMSLLYKNDFEDSVLKENAFIKLFYNCDNLIDASELSLPNNELYSGCYAYMFEKCDNLINAPKLPAKKLASYCYRYMFADCISLTTAPELPATNLQTTDSYGESIECSYQYMFSGCTSLTTVPNISAKYFGVNSCSYMFYGCTSLTKLEQSTLTHSTGIVENYCCSYMFAKCSSLTTAPKLETTSMSQYCYQGMFENCSSLTSAPTLDSTSLDVGCYKSMFNSCNKLTKSVKLPAIIASNYCYQSMFENCTRLTTALTISARGVTISSFQDMFKGCTSLTSVQSTLSATSLEDAENCYYGMFEGCTSLTTAPALPATALASSCYTRMFMGCTSLTTAPELPASDIKFSFCYRRMFYGCSKLNYIKMLATDIISTRQALDNWVSGVASSGTFVKHTSISESTIGRGASGIPNGWNVTSSN